MRTLNVRIMLTKTALFCGTVLTLTAALLSGPTAPTRAFATPPVSSTPGRVAKPDLIISDVLPYYEFIYGQGWVERNDKLWVQVANIGNGNAKAFTVLFQWGMGYSYQQQYYGFAGMNAGKSEWIVVESNVYNPYTHMMADYNLWASGANFQLVADFGNAINEWDETNNVYNHYTP